MLIKEYRICMPITVEEVGNLPGIYGLMLEYLTFSTKLGSCI